MDRTDLAISALVLSGRHVATAALNGQFHVELAIGVEGGDVQIRVVELHTCWRGDVRCSNDAWALLAQVGNDWLVVLGRDRQVLDVQEPVR